MGLTSKVYISKPNMSSPLGVLYNQKIIGVVRPDGSQTCYTLDFKVANNYFDIGDFVLQPVVDDNYPDYRPFYFITGLPSDHTYVLWKSKFDKNEFIKTLKPKEIVRDWTAIVYKLVLILDDICHSKQISSVMGKDISFRKSPNMERIMYYG